MYNTWHVLLLLSCIISNLICHFVFRKHGLSDDTVDFIGHALALHRDDRYLNEPALDTVKRMKVRFERRFLKLLFLFHIIL
jgi:RAB protein geranylgeranyltransferase component A